MGFLSKLFKATHPPLPPVVLPESFADLSSPDQTFDAAGLTFGAYSHGFFTVYTVGHRQEPVSIIPEASSAVLLAVGLVAVLAAARRRRG